MTEKREAIIVGPCRVSYANLFKPRKNDINGRVEYSAVLLLPKEVHKNQADPNGQLTKIKDAMKAAAVEKFGANPPAGLKWPLKDGDKETNDEGQPRWPGYMYMTVMSYAETSDGDPKDGPAMKDCNNRTIDASSGFVSGDWVKAKVFFSPYDTKGNKGVKVFVNAVQWLYKDEPFGSGRNDDFEPVAGAAVPASAPADDSDYDVFADS